MLSMEQRTERDALLLSLVRFDLSRLVFNKDIADPEALSLIDKDEVMFDGGVVLCHDKLYYFSACSQSLLS